MRAKMHCRVEVYVLLWTKKNGGGGGCLRLQRMKAIDLWLRKSRTHKAGTFLLDHLGWMGTKCALVNKPLLGTSLLTILRQTF